MRNFKSHFPVLLSDIFSSSSSSIGARYYINSIHGMCHHYVSSFLKDIYRDPGIHVQPVLKPHNKCHAYSNHFSIVNISNSGHISVFSSFLPPLLFGGGGVFLGSLVNFSLKLLVHRPLSVYLTRTMCLYKH